MDKQNLENKRDALITKLNGINQKIDDYGLLDIACDSGPFKDLINEKNKILLQLENINRDLNSN